MVRANTFMEQPLQLHGHIMGGKGPGPVKTITRSTSDSTIVTIFLLSNTFVSNEKQNQNRTGHSKSIPLALSSYMSILFFGHLEIRSYRFLVKTPRSVPDCLQYIRLSLSQFPHSEGRECPEQPPTASPILLLPSDASVSLSTLLLSSQFCRERCNSHPSACSTVI